MSEEEKRKMYTAMYLKQLWNYFRNMDKAKRKPEELKSLRESLGLSIEEISDVMFCKPEDILLMESTNENETKVYDFARHMYCDILIGIKYTKEN